VHNTRTHADHAKRDARSKGPHLRAKSNTSLSAATLDMAGDSAATAELVSAPAGTTARDSRLVQRERRGVRGTMLSHYTVLSQGTMLSHYTVL